ALIGKPVIVGGANDRSVVAACSYETRIFGVHSAMPSSLARRLCPDAIWVRSDYDIYAHYSRMVTQIMEERLPILEKASIDEFYADLSGMDKFMGNTYKYATELRKKITLETGLQLSFGMSTGKTVSKVATNEAKPAGQMLIPSGQERSFLHPLSIEKMPFIGKMTAQKLRNMGITSIGLMAQMPLRMIEAVFGQNGIHLWQHANGVDHSPVVVYSEQKSMSKEITFDRDTTDIALLKSVVSKMVEDLCLELRQKNRCTGQISVKIRYSTFETYTRQMAIPITAHDDVIQEKALQIFEKLYERRLLIRLVGVKFSKLIPGYSQIRLFDNSERRSDLYQAMDKIRHKHGHKAVMQAYGIQLYEARKVPLVAETGGLPAHLLKRLYAYEA
ncbi:MAG: DNA polymerase Y family protein, partial [Leadbetterella sp.]